MRLTGKLTVRQIEGMNEPGRYSDGRGAFGLSLLVHANADGTTSKYFTQRLKIADKWTSLSLGKHPIRTLKDARLMALENARAVDGGEDPRKPRGTGVNGGKSFSDMTEGYYQSAVKDWKDGDDGHYAKMWMGGMKNHVLPKIGSMAVDEIGIGDVKGIIASLWADKRATAEHTYRRMKVVFDWAVSEGHIKANPCSPAVLAGFSKAKRQKSHHKSVHHADLHAVLDDIRASDAHEAVIDVLEFIALTGVRSNEARGATWGEIDLCGTIDGPTWTIPASRMKGGIEFRVPLSDAALAVLSRSERTTTSRADGYGDSDDNDLLFPSPRGKVLHAYALGRVFKDLDIPSTTHGFRASFRNWCGDNAIDRDLAESALAHVRHGVEGAYYTSDLFERRRELMERWGGYLTDHHRAGSSTSRKLVSVA